MQRRSRFTKRTLEAVRPPSDSARARYFDTVSPYLCLRVTRVGAKSYYYRRKLRGAYVEVQLGPFGAMTVEQARKAADAINGDIAQGHMPGARRHTVATVRELHAAYVSQHLEANGKSTANARSYWRVYLKPWAARKIGDLTRADVLRLRTRIQRKRSNRTANQVVEFLRAAINWARDEELYTGDNPAQGLKKLTENSRERFLQPEEMRQFFEALEDSDPDFRDFVLMLLFTGARRGNVQAMRWDQVSFERAAWDIPSTSTKTDRPYTLPLTPEAIAILETRRKHANGSEWVFPSHGATGHLVEPKNAWAEFRERAGLPDLWMHDLRRTLGSWQAGAGASLSIIGKSLGHQSPAATAVYARLQLDPVRQSVASATQAMLEAAK